MEQGHQGWGSSEPAGRQQRGPALERRSAKKKGMTQTQAEETAMMKKVKGQEWELKRKEQELK